MRSTIVISLVSDKYENFYLKKNQMSVSGAEGSYDELTYFM